MGWLLSACSSRSPLALRGVAVEPVGEYFQDAQTLLQRGRFSNVAVVQVALGQWDGTVPLWRVEVASPVALAAMSAGQRAPYDWDMSYLRNMSSVGDLSSHLYSSHLRMFRNFGVRVPLRCDTVPVWSWRRLVRKIVFYGCEVLVLDTEGCESKK